MQAKYGNMTLWIKQNKIISTDTKIIYGTYNFFKYSSLGIFSYNMKSNKSQVAKSSTKWPPVQLISSMVLHTWKWRAFYHFPFTAYLYFCSQIANDNVNMKWWEIEILITAKGITFL